MLSVYADKYPDKFVITQRKKNSGSAKHNFMDIIIKNKSAYVMLCDQDDVWLPDKIEKTLSQMKKMEQMYPNTPILVRTDLCVVNNDLDVINPSYKKAMHSNFGRTELRHVLIQNTFAGCTAMYNKVLADLIIDEPDYCIMHDWWIELVASAFGKLCHIDEPTALYRQHDKNEIGAKDVRKLSYKIDRVIHYKEVKEAIRITYKQAESFLKIYKDKLQKNQIVLLERYCMMPTLSKLSRWKTICSLGTYKNGLSRNIAYFLFV